MGQAAYSDDLRSRVVAEWQGGASRRAAARRFRVSASSAIRWVAQYRRIGSARAQPRRRRSRSPLEPHAAWLQALLAREPDLTLEQIAARVCAELGLRTSKSAVDRFCVRHKLTFKKTLHAAEQQRPDVARARRIWKFRQVRLDPRRLVFIDETGTSTKMVRASGRCARGRRLIGRVPHGHWKTTTFTCGLRCDGLVAPYVLDGPMNGDCFRAYVEHILVPTLQPGDVVVLDNLRSHKGEAVRRAIEATGARRVFLPPYSPDFNPLELLLAKLKTLLRRAAERSIPALWDRIGQLLDSFTPTECYNYFRHAGYAPP